MEDFGTRPLPVEAQDLHDGLMSGICVSPSVFFSESDRILTGLWGLMQCRSNCVWEWWQTLEERNGISAGKHK